MYRINTVEGEEVVKAATERPPFGPGFSEELVAQATRMEVWGTNFADQGEDYCEFRLFDADGELLVIRTLRGY